MKTRIALIALAALALILAGTLAVVGYTAYGSCRDGSTSSRSCCRGSSPAGTTGEAVQPTWLDAQVEGNTVSIPLSEVDSGKIVHFRVTSEGTSMAFMAYKLGGEIYVRAAICPPCRSENFSLTGDTLDCSTCHTKFKAGTGEGISGACRNYPKAEVTHTITGDRITMAIGDLVTAYQNTQSPGLP